MRKLLILLTLSLVAGFFLAGQGGCTAEENKEFQAEDTSVERKIELAAEGTRRATTNPVLQGAATILAPGWGNVALGATGSIAAGVGLIAGFFAGKKKKKRKRSVKQS